MVIGMKSMNLSLPSNCLNFFVANKRDLPIAERIMPMTSSVGTVAG